MGNTKVFEPLKKVALAALFFSLFGCGGGGDGEVQSSSDTTPPVISVMGDNPATVEQGETYSDAGATADDAVDGSVTVTTTGDDVDTSKVGTYTITYVATDAAGNEASASRTVKVQAAVTKSDTTPPVITVLGDNPTQISQGQTYKDAGATADDDVDGSVDVVTTGSVDTNVTGDYTMTYEATDSSGNQATATRTVTVVQSQGPFVSIEQGLSSISMLEGDEKIIAFVVKFIDGNAAEYGVQLEQSVTPASGVSYTSNYPNGGWLAAEDNSWVVNVTLNAVTAGEYTFTSVVNLVETGQTMTLSLPITVTDTASRSSMKLSTPGTDKDAITLGQTEELIVSAKVTRTTTAPETLTLEQVDEAGTGVIATLGSLRDDGIAPDIVARDLVYTGLHTVSKNSIGELYYRVTNGEIKSGVHTLSVTQLPTSVAPSDFSALITDESGNQIFSNELLVKFVDVTSEDRIQEIVASENGTIVGTVLSLGIYQLQVETNNSLSSLEQVIESLQTYTEVDYVEYSVLASIDAYPNDSEFLNQSNMTTIRADKAWYISSGDTLVGVVDTGIDYTHADLDSKIIKGIDSVSGDDDPMDENGHGTHVAGLIGAESNNSDGIASVAWNSKILAVRGLGGSYAALVSAIRYSADRGTKVVNISGGGYVDSVSLNRVIDYASNKGALIVSTAGNDASNKRKYPCYYEQTLCVGNATDLDERAPLSNFGTWVDIAAPGENARSTQLGGGTSIKSGTSMAAPLVSGSAAVIWTQHPEWEPKQIRERLLRSGKSVDAALLIGTSRVDLFEAVFNGGFEIGDLAEWETSGTASSITELGSLRPPSGNRMALLSTGPEEDQAETTLLKSFVIQPGVTELTLELTYNFLTEEYPEFLGSPFDDILLITLTLPDGTQQELARDSVNDSEFTLIDGIDFPGGDDTVGHIGFKNVSLTIPVTQGQGEYRINISDSEDDLYDSVLLIDDIVVK
ncbi:S8 family serine peptidase [Vibrio sp. DNB22_19_1]